MGRTLFLPTKKNHKFKPSKYRSIKYTIQFVFHGSVNGGFSHTYPPQKPYIFLHFLWDLKGFLAVSPGVSLGTQSKPPQAFPGCWERRPSSATWRRGSAKKRRSWWCCRWFPVRREGAADGWRDPWPILPGSRGSTPPFFGSKNGGLPFLVWWVLLPTKIMVKLGNQPIKNGGWTSRDLVSV